jgi:hypothetical protein
MWSSKAKLPLRPLGITVLFLASLTIPQYVFASDKVGLSFCGERLRRGGGSEQRVFERNNPNLRSNNDTYPVRSPNDSSNPNTCAYGDFRSNQRAGCSAIPNHGSNEHRNSHIDTDQLPNCNVHFNSNVTTYGNSIHPHDSHTYETPNISSNASPKLDTDTSANRDSNSSTNCYAYTSPCPNALC